MSKHIYLEKICRLNELYLTGELSSIFEYLRNVESSYRKEGWESFSIYKFDGYYWLCGSKE